MNYAGIQLCFPRYKQLNFTSRFNFHFAAMRVCFPATIIIFHKFHDTFQISLLSSSFLHRFSVHNLNSKFPHNGRRPLACRNFDVFVHPSFKSAVAFTTPSPVGPALQRDLILPARGSPYREMNSRKYMAAGKVRSKDAAFASRLNRVR